MTLEFMMCMNITIPYFLFEIWENTLNITFVGYNFIICHKQQVKKTNTGSITSTCHICLQWCQGEAQEGFGTLGEGHCLLI